MKTLPIILVAALALAGCTRDAPESDATSDTSDADTATADIASRDPTPTDSAVASPAPSPSAPPATGDIPNAVLGRWGLVPADCTSTRGDAKGLLVIEPRLLRFFESRGVLRDIAEVSDTRIRASFTFSGEGMEWQRDEVLDVQDGGKTLIRREYGDEAAPGPFKYSRCS